MRTTQPNSPNDPTYGESFVAKLDAYLAAVRSCGDDVAVLLPSVRGALVQEIDDIVNLIPQTLEDLTL